MASIPVTSCNGARSLLHSKSRSSTRKKAHAGVNLRRQARLQELEARTPATPQLMHRGCHRLRNPPDESSYLASDLLEVPGFFLREVPARVVEKAFVFIGRLIEQGLLQGSNDRRRSNAKYPR
jgi:hypothetical protein